MHIVENSRNLGLDKDVLESNYSKFLFLISKIKPTYANCEVLEITATEM